MKVCSQCEFIYEDDQSVCDMDGAALVFDPAPRGLKLGLAAQSTAPLANSRWKRLAASAVAGVVLGTVVVLVFQVQSLRGPAQLSTSTGQKPDYRSSQAGGDSTLPAGLDLTLPVPLASPAMGLPVEPSSSPVDPPPDTKSIASPQPPAPQSTRSRERAPKATSEVLPERSARVTRDISPPVKPAIATGSRSSHPASRSEEVSRKAERAELRPVAENKKGSKLGSFLKRTGSILKKPFRI